MKPRGITTSKFGIRNKKTKSTDISAEKRKQHAKSLIGYRPDGDAS